MPGRRRLRTERKSQTRRNSTREGQTMMKTGWSGLAFVVLLLAAGSALAKGKTNDFPTAARVEYVLACMSGTAQDYAYLNKCSCALDAIASHVSLHEIANA